MGLRLLEAKDDRCCFYDSVEGMVLGPVFPDRVIAQAFERWVHDQWDELLERGRVLGFGLDRHDPGLHRLEPVTLNRLYIRFCKENPVALEGSG